MPANKSLVQFYGRFLTWNFLPALELIGGPFHPFFQILWVAETKMQDDRMNTALVYKAYSRVNQVTDKRAWNLTYIV